jgi:hypothetical protein
LPSNVITRLARPAETAHVAKASNNVQAGAPARVTARAMRRGQVKPADGSSGMGVVAEGMRKTLGDKNGADGAMA